MSNVPIIGHDFTFTIIFVLIITFVIIWSNDSIGLYITIFTSFYTISEFSHKIKNKTKKSLKSSWTIDDTFISNMCFCL